MNSEKQVRPPSLDIYLVRHRTDIVQSLEANPTVKVEFFDSPADEVHGLLHTISFGIFPRGEVFDVWRFDEDLDEPLVWEDSYRSADLAKHHLLCRASEVQTQKGDLLNEQKDDLWEEWKISRVTLLPPFKFYDTGSSAHGVLFEFQMDVEELFERNSWLLSPNEWPTGYGCKLYDSEGKQCWVKLSHRGEFALFAMGSE